MGNEDLKIPKFLIKTVIKQLEDMSKTFIQIADVLKKNLEQSKGAGNE